MIHSNPKYIIRVSLKTFFEALYNSIDMKSQFLFLCWPRKYSKKWSHVIPKDPCSIHLSRIQLCIWQQTVRIVSIWSFPLLPAPYPKSLVALPNPNWVAEPPPKDEVAEPHASPTADEKPEGARAEEAANRGRGGGEDGGWGGEEQKDGEQMIGSRWKSHAGRQVGTGGTVGDKRRQSDCLARKWVKAAVWSDQPSTLRRILYSAQKPHEKFQMREKAMFNCKLETKSIFCRLPKDY